MRLPEPSISCSIIVDVIVFNDLPATPAVAERCTPRSLLGLDLVPDHAMVQSRIHHADLEVAVRTDPDIVGNYRPINIAPDHLAGVVVVEGTGRPDLVEEDTVQMYSVRNWDACSSAVAARIAGLGRRTPAEDPAVVEDTVDVAVHRIADQTPTMAAVDTAGYDLGLVPARIGDYSSSEEDLRIPSTVLIQVDSEKDSSANGFEEAQARILDNHRVGGVAGFLAQEIRTVRLVLVRDIRLRTWERSWCSSRMSSAVDAETLDPGNPLNLRHHGCLDWVGSSIASRGLDFDRNRADSACCHP